MATKKKDAKYWRNKFKEIADSVLHPESGPYAGRTTIFMGSVITFFCFCTAALDIRDGVPAKWWVYLLGAIGLYDIGSGIVELKKQKKYEEAKKILKSPDTSIEGTTERQGDMTEG